MGLDNPLHIAFLLLVLLLVFGARRLPEMGRSLGSGLREFKQSIGGELSQPLTPPVAPIVSEQPHAQSAASTAASSSRAASTSAGTAPGSTDGM